MMTAPQLAAEAGVSLPTVHKLLDQQGVPRSGRGSARAVPAAAATAILNDASEGVSETELRILTALWPAPLGYVSRRALSRRAGVSPTTASRYVDRMIRLGLVDERDEARVDGGDVHTVPVIRAVDGPFWQEMRPLLNRHRERLMPKSLPEQKVPRGYWHLFWNADPAKLRVGTDGQYIARRMLTSFDPGAELWALQHIPEAEVRAAVRGRGIHPSVSALVDNWFRH